MPCRDQRFGGRILRRSSACAAAVFALAAAAADAAPVQHVKVLVHNRDVFSSGQVERSTSSSEEWHRGRQTNTVSHDAGLTRESIVDAAGVLVQRHPGGPDTVIRAEGATADTRRVIAMQQRGSVAQFLREFRAGRESSASNLRFAGRPARRSVYHPERDFPETQMLYVDRETGLPLGRTGHYSFSTLDGHKRTRFTTATFTVIKNLKPTAKHVAKLTHFVVQPTT